MNTEDIILLVKSQVERVVGERVHIMNIRPDESAGWTVFFAHGGIAWKQRVTHEGTLDSCSRHYPQLETMMQ
jgi:hypothetical protein